MDNDRCKKEKRPEYLNLHFSLVKHHYKNTDQDKYGLH